VDPRSDGTSLPPIDPAEFRRAMRHVPTPVAIVAAVVDGTPVGLTVGSFASVSLSPALITFFVDQGSTTWPILGRSDTFTVNILGHGQGERCRTFAQRSEDRFTGVEWTPSAHGDPVLSEAALVLACTKHSTRTLGDHIQVVGETRQLHVLREDLPLVFHQGGFLNLEHLLAV
jgi:3-hydroxy-9,10-secoandrosta-1,3,5(10)-triene-9,17-dione monooxygenase reductase component